MDETNTPKSPCCSQETEVLAPQCTCTCKTCRKPRYWLWILGFLAVYVFSVIPVGLFLYTAKSNLGIDVFRHGGYHTFKWCLIQSVRGERTKTTEPASKQ